MSETPLPSLYARWMETLLGATIPNESKATCAQCAMCQDDVPADMRFLPDAKCCTYHPQIANFLVGLILADASPEAGQGRAVIARQVNEGFGATPFGISPAPSFAKVYAGVRSDGTFGRDTSLMCPYFINDNGGQCGIWRYRNSVCSTYFCKTVRGAPGSAFWQTVTALLKEIETQLSLWCLFELSEGLVLDALFDRKGQLRKFGDGALRGYVDAERGRLSPNLARQIWGSWYGKEEQFYRACAARVADLEWRDVKAKASVRFEILEARARKAFAAAHSDSMPDVLCKTNFAVEAIEDGVVQLRSPSAPFEPLQLSESMAAALAEFDGRPTGDVVQAIASGRGVVIDSALLKTLLERGIVAAPNGTDIPKSLQPDHPLRADDVLGFFRGFTDEEVWAVERSGDDGAPRLVLRCGAKELEFDEPDLFDFARQLVEHQNGFVAGDAMGWAAEGLPWSRVSELLTAMLAEDVLQRFPAPAAQSLRA